MRRSSTARSLGARSDFEEPPVGLGIQLADGDGTEEGSVRETVERSENGTLEGMEDGVRDEAEKAFADNGKAVREKLEEYSFAGRIS